MVALGGSCIRAFLSLLLLLTAVDGASSTLVLNELFGASGRVFAAKVTDTGFDEVAYGYEPGWMVRGAV